MFVRGLRYHCIHQRHLSLCGWVAGGAFMCFGGGMALESDWHSFVGSYAFKASLLLLTSLKLSTLHLLQLLS